MTTCHSRVLSPNAQELDIKPWTMVKLMRTSTVQTHDAVALQVDNPHNAYGKLAAVGKEESK